MDDKKTFQCADIVNERINRITKWVIALLVLVALLNCLFCYLMYYFLRKETVYLHYRVVEALEQLHNVQIVKGKVYPRVVSQYGVAPISSNDVAKGIQEGKTQD